MLGADFYGEMDILVRLIPERSFPTFFSEFWKLGLLCKFLSVAAEKDA